MLLLVMGALVASQAYRLALRSSDFLASVLPSVLIDLANDDRRGGNVAVLTQNPLLKEAARLKAEDMVSRGYFAHVSPEGVSPWHWISQAGYEFAYAGENLAVNFDDSAAVNDAWMRSPGHRENILNGHFTEVGIAVARGMHEGQETLFVVEMFGSPVSKSKVAGVSDTLAVASSPKPVPKVQEVKVVPIASSNVLGAESQTFVAVKNVNATESGSGPTETAFNPNKVAYASLSDAILTSPSKLLAVVYLVFSLVLVALLLAVLSVRHERRARHAVFIALVFLLVVTIYYTYYLLAPAGVTVLGVTS